MASGYSSDISSSSSSNRDEDDVLICKCSESHTIYCNRNRKEEIMDRSEENDDGKDGEIKEPTDRAGATRELQTDVDYEDGEIKEPTDQTDAAQEYRANDYEEDYCSRHYLFCHRPEMKEFYTRMQTFGWWPIQLRQKPRGLAKAGFYYTGDHDAVVCYCCGLRAYRWQRMDDPVMEHYRLSPRCPYVNNVFRH
ncbi:baculoviral IAP repeat-containing protein 2-like [Gigantopelta aegis]|uniref:baculoviral IAP repeat-containing protein 2-like n=1 Tax=Gigantopelta aegis TaxID=1735272 RepID=UPI001B88BD05|nr:baculoviral IAP repeat-containing protein 2-like [Gigantopelta aegis]